MPNITKTYDVFLSYALEDREWVSEFTRALQESGVHNWFDVNDILPGDPWVEKLQSALRESQTLLVFLSPNSVESPFVFFELGAAVADQKRIIPVLIGDLESQSIPPLLAQRQVLRATSPTEAGKQVARILQSPPDLTP